MCASFEQPKEGNGAPASRNEGLHTGLWALMGLCILGGISMTRFRSPLLTGLLCAGFWASLVAYLFSWAEVRRGVGWFLPLGLLYSFIHHHYTFVWNKLVLEPPLLGTDGQRFFRLANHWGLEERHVGWSLLTFALHPAQGLARLLDLGAGGRAFLHMEMAVFGMLAATLVYCLLRREVAARVPCILSAYFFALSLAIWTQASVIDTYIVSVFLFFVFLWEARQYLSGERRLPVLLGLVTGVSLSISLENVYCPLVFVALFPLLRRTRPRPWRHVSFYGFTVAGFYLMCVGVKHLATGGDFASRVLTHADRFASPAALFSGKAFLRAGFSESVACVLAQHGVPVMKYASGLPKGIEGSTALYLALLGVLLTTVLTASRSAAPRSDPFLWVLLGVFAVRHAFLMSFAVSENILFAGPSIGILALFLGRGAALVQASRRKLALYAGTLVLLDVLLFLCNGSYLLKALAHYEERFR